jgi:hypothetical protein
MSKKMNEIDISFKELCILLDKCSKLGVKEFELGGLRFRLDGKIQEPPLTKSISSYEPAIVPIPERAGTVDKYIKRDFTEDELNLLSVEDPSAYEEYIMGKVQDGDARDIED